MNIQLKQAMFALKWSVGLVALFESCLLALEPVRIHAFEHAGLPHIVRPILAGSEFVAAGLFLVPSTSRWGGYFLLAVFAFAALIHVLHGQFDIGALVVYSASVAVTLAHHHGAESEVAHEG